MSDAIWIVLEDGRIMTMQGAEPDFYTEGCDASLIIPCSTSTVKKLTAARWITALKKRNTGISGT